MYLEAAKVLKKAFEKTANPELLETLEVLYKQSGAEEQILEIIGGIHKSGKKLFLLPSLRKTALPK